MQNEQLAYSLSIIKNQGLYFFILIELLYMVDKQQQYVVEIWIILL
jgi:hypothetical protein